MFIIRILLLAAFALGYNVARGQTATETPEPPAAAPAPSVTLNKWQDMAPLLDRQSKWINKLRAENETLKSDRDVLVWKYDILLRYLVIHACANNGKLASINAVFSWVKPFPLGNHECPPEGTRFYIPTYASPTGPPIPPTPQDDFNRADGPAGANWSAGNIAGNKLRVLGTALWTKPLAADQYIEARMTASSTAEWAYHGVVLRASDSKIQYRFTISPVEGKFGLEYMDAAGAHHSLASGPVTYVAGAQMRLAAKGGVLTAYYNGIKLGEATDTRIAAGSAGLIGLAPAGQYAEFDDVLVGDL